MFLIPFPQSLGQLWLIFFFILLGQGIVEPKNSIVGVHFFQRCVISVEWLLTISQLPIIVKLMIIG